MKNSVQVFKCSSVQHERQGTRGQGIKGSRGLKILKVFPSNPRTLEPSNLFLKLCASVPLCLCAVSFCLLPAPARAEVIWGSFHSSLFSDIRARRVGDLVTLIISEASSATSTANTNTKKETSIENEAGTGILSFLKEFGFNHASEFKGGGKTLRGGNLSAKVTCKVVEVLPSGDLKIEGKQEIQINNEKQTIILTGVIRQQDIRSDNTILSTFVSDAQIKYEGHGPLAKKQKQGLLSKLFKLDWLF